MVSPTGTATGEPRDLHPRREPGGTDAPTPAEALDRLQDLMLRRLEQLEILAVEQSSQLELSPDEREQAIRERVAVLEASLARLQAELKRREQEWQDLVAELESDRTLLAEAWDRLERERVEVQPAQAGPAARTAAAAPERISPAAPFGPTDDRMTREILRQFQTLKADVRRSAGRAGPL